MPASDWLMGVGCVAVRSGRACTPDTVSTRTYSPDPPAQTCRGPAQRSARAVAAVVSSRFGSKKPYGPVTRRNRASAPKPRKLKFGFGSKIPCEHFAEK